MASSLPLNPPEAPSQPDWLRTVTERTNGLRFGSILITIHDGRVTQIDTLEKIRITPASSNSGSPNSD